jgi:hypothetical protein
MKKHQRIVWLAASCLVLAACQPCPALQTPGATIAKGATCDFSAAGTPEAPERYRAWVLFKVDDAPGAAAKIGKPYEKGLSLLTDPENPFVIVRADVVDGNSDYNLVVPVDALDADAFSKAKARLIAVVGKDPTVVLHVAKHFPAPPQRSATFVTDKELKECYLSEYDPAGRHPHSPGANPWG